MCNVKSSYLRKSFISHMESEITVWIFPKENYFISHMCETCDPVLTGLHWALICWKLHLLVRESPAGVAVTLHKFNIMPSLARWTGANVDSRLLLVNSLLAKIFASIRAPVSLKKSYSVRTLIQVLMFGDHQRNIDMEKAIWLWLPSHKFKPLYAAS